MSLADAALRTIRRHQLLPRGGRVAVALSGGPDSVALLHVLLELSGGTHGRPALGPADLRTSGPELVVAGIAHFNHQLRGDDADADERFCAHLAASLGLPFECGREDVRARARAGRRSIEDAARSARYEFLAAAAARLDAVAVAVGHTLDDQAETFLLRLIRGAGSRGLAGIRPKAGTVVRPLIEVRRRALRAYLAERSLASREDASNDDVSIPRNRVRHELIPYLEREFSPGIVEVLAREAATAREDEEQLHAEAIEKAAFIVLTDNSAGGGLRIRADELVKLQPALAARVAREALGRLAADRYIGYDQISRFLEFASTSRAGAALSLPGQQAVHEGRTVVLRPEPPRGVEGHETNDFRIPLSIPGEVVLSSAGVAVSAEWGTDSDMSGGSGGCLIQGAKLPLAVRSRKPGDRFQPPGMGGRSKKLQDYLVDRKVARNQRDLLPLVVDGDDRIVWVVGHGVSEDFRAAAPSNGVIFLKARQLGGEV